LVIDIAFGRFTVARHHRETRHAEQGFAGIRVQCQRLFEGGLRVFLLAAGQQRLAAQRQQRGRLGGHVRGQIHEQFLELALLHHRLAQQRQDAFGRDAERARLAEFFFGRRGIAQHQLQIAQLDARLTILRALLDRIFHLNQGRLEVTLLLVLLGFGQQ
jgi:hypothetical protein